MTGARLVHDTLEQEGWDVEIADAQNVKGLAPLACKTDRIDSQVLAVLSHRDLVPAIWLPDPRIREERELARFRLHLVKHKSALKCRVHSTLINFGKPCPSPTSSEPRAAGCSSACAGRSPGAATPQRASSERRPRGPNRRDQSAPVRRQGSPRPVDQAWPTYLRWALLEATMHARKHPALRRALPAQQAPLGKQRGAKVAQINIARRLAHAIWHMLASRAQRGRLAPALLQRAGARSVAARKAAESCF